MSVLAQSDFITLTKNTLGSGTYDGILRDLHKGRNEFLNEDMRDITPSPRLTRNIHNLRDLSISPYYYQDYIYKTIYRAITARDKIARYSILRQSYTLSTLTLLPIHKYSVTLVKRCVLEGKSNA